jgi:hypothetical protein
MMWTWLLSSANAGLDELHFESMSDWEGAEYKDTEHIQASYERVSLQLGAAIANSALQPCKSNGITGIGIDLNSSFSFIDTRRSIDGTPSPWALMTPDELPSEALWITELVARKGLPMSSEIGAKIGYIGMSKQGNFGAWGRIVPLEGYAQLPDVAIQIGYSGYIGSNQLAVGTTDMGIAIGKGFPMGPQMNVKETIVSPFAAVGKLNIKAMPRVSAALQEELGVASFGSTNSSKDNDKSHAPIYAGAGVQILNNDFRFQMSYRYTASTLSTISGSVGFLY